MWNEYITQINLNKLRNTPPCSINIGNGKIKHILITGPNGSGKTTFVRELYESLSVRIIHSDDLIQKIREGNGLDVAAVKRYFEQSNNDFYREMVINDIPKKNAISAVTTNLNKLLEYYVYRETQKYILYYSEAHREGKFQKPNGPVTLPERSSGEQFVQLLVNLRNRQSYFFEEKSTVSDSEKKAETERKYNDILNWFGSIKSALGELLEHDNFELVYDPIKYDYKISEAGKEPYDFTQLSDGYSAILRIVADLMLKMSTAPEESYLLPGIAIVDEIETHLHVELQQKILPFLTKFFPNIQFIVTTHSPFVLSSIENSVIFDMSSQQQLSDFSHYSYSNIIEGYFNVSKYSQFLLQELEKAIQIIEQESLSDADIKAIKAFDQKILNLPDLRPLEAKNKWLDAKLHNFNKINGKL